jgi:Xaa-Pro aminopeptidase
MRILPPTAQVGVWHPGGPVALVPIPYYADDARRRAPWLEVIDPRAGATRDDQVLDLVGGAREVGLMGVTWSLGAALSRASHCADAGGLLAVTRAAKVPGEAALVRRAVAVAEIGMRAAAEAIRAGVSEQDIAAEAERAMRVRGGDGHAVVARGATAAGLTELAGAACLEPGDCVLVDLGCYLDGYRGEFARTFCVGEPSRPLRDAHEAVERAIEEGEGALRAGGAASGPADAARRCLEDHGFPARTLPHPVGHGLGVSGGEKPDIERGSEDLIPRCSVVNLEPGVFDPTRDLAVRIEDTYEIDGDGVRRMTMTSRELLCCA